MEFTEFLATKNPPKYSWLNEWCEEVFLALHSIVQLHYLNTKDASFAESFYGIYRVEGNCKMSTKTRCWSLFCLVGLPYLARKTEKYVSTLQNQKLSYCHKTVLVTWKTVSLVQFLMYLTGRATAHSPLLTLVNLNLQYIPEQPQVSMTWTDCFSHPKACMRMVSNGLTQGLEVGAFFLQCLQWWHSDESSGKLASTVVPPPPPVTCAVEDSPFTLCPVCHQKCHIETALASSGYVFCFRCIREAISANQQCPVTGLPSTLDQLVRLYPSTDT
ncbi:peroxisome assembly protein 12 isoform X2 [Macrosteles quadrilineatus]|uniref:peroxisome assembly protein 12 isoform X2 n=1 Tax=Macrosteles quadrilineatus TaxID=74068 RepID=UPI0023E2657C|nr:peroxisome assembly protein 12 isoform X2 [Macrosteles quadrilineatus]